MSARQPAPLMTPLQDPDASSLVVQVRKAVLAAILDGRFRERLPTEDELGTMLGVSRTTVRAAVQELERDGLVTRRRAIGTVINPHVGFEALALQRLVGFDWLLRAKGDEVEIESTWKRRSPTELAAHLPEIADSDCCVISRRYFADGVLAIALVDVIPWDELETHSLPTPPPESLFEFSQKYMGRSINSAVAQLVPMVVTDASTTELDIPTGTPFLRLVETHYDSAGDALGWSRVDLLDSKMRVAVFRPR